MARGSSVVLAVVQSVRGVRLFVTPWTAAHQPSLSIANSQSLLKLMSIELVIPSNHLILCHPLLLPPSIFPSIRVFSSESALCIRWPKFWGFSFSIGPSNEYSGLIYFRTDWFDLPAVQGPLGCHAEGLECPLNSHRHSPTPPLGGCHHFQAQYCIVGTRRLRFIL